VTKEEENSLKKEETTAEKDWYNTPRRDGLLPFPKTKRKIYSWDGGKRRKKALGRYVMT